MGGHQVVLSCAPLSSPSNYYGPAPSSRMRLPCRWRDLVALDQWSIPTEVLFHSRKRHSADLTAPRVVSLKSAHPTARLMGGEQQPIGAFLYISLFQLLRPDLKFESRAFRTTHGPISRPGGSLSYPVAALNGVPGRIDMFPVCVSKHQPRTADSPCATVEVGVFCPSRYPRQSYPA